MLAVAGLCRTAKYSARLHLYIRRLCRAGTESNVSEGQQSWQYMLPYLHIDVKIVDPERSIAVQRIDSNSLVSVICRAVDQLCLTGIAQTDRSKLYAHQKKRFPSSALYGSRLAVRCDAR